MTPDQNRSETIADDLLKWIKPLMQAITFNAANSAAAVSPGAGQAVPRQV